MRRVFSPKRRRRRAFPISRSRCTRFSGSPAITDAVLSGNVDVGAFGSPGLLIAWEKTKGHQDVAGLAALGANAFILETNKPQIKSIADFGDSDQIAVPATTSPQAVVMRMAAEKTFGDYRRLDKLLVSMPHPDATAALLSGQIISGYVATAPFTAMLKTQRQGPCGDDIEGDLGRGNDRRCARRRQEIRRCQSGGRPRRHRGGRGRHEIHRQGPGAPRPTSISSRKPRRRRRKMSSAF